MVAQRKNRAGRPRKYKTSFLKELAVKMEAYTDATDIPILAEFAYLNGVEQTVFYDNNDIFSSVRKKLLAKKEAQLEKKALRNEVNSSAAIFSLKQLGWRDERGLKLSSPQGGPVQVAFVDLVKEADNAKET